MWRPDFHRLRDFVVARQLALSLVVMLAVGGLALEENRQSFPPLIAWQSRAYTLLAWLDPQRSRADHVVVVEVDDRTWEVKEFCGITDRHFLAHLVRTAARSGANEVVLDIDLVRVARDKRADRVAANADLLAAFKEVGKRSSPLPVIIGVGFDSSGSELPNVFADAELPTVVPGGGPPFGFDNGPDDERTLPLVYEGRRLADREVVPFFSLALRAADTFGRQQNFKPAIVERPPVSRAIRAGEYVYSTFLPPSEFNHVSAVDVANGAPAALRQLVGRIVLIGGNRRDTSRHWIDQHATPIGQMAGVYIHANRIEALLQGHLKGTLPWWVPLFVDLALGFAMVVLWGNAKTLVQRVGAIALCAIPIAVAYVLFVNLQYALDFALPLFVLILDFALETYHELGRAPGGHP